MTNFKTMFTKLTEANPETQFTVILKKRTAIAGSVPAEKLTLPAGWTVDDFSLETGTDKVFITNFSSEAENSSNRVFFEYVQSPKVKFNKFALWFANLTWR